MTLNTAHSSTWRFLCAISDAPDVALLLCTMLQDKPAVKLPARREDQTPIEKVEFKCFGIMSVLSFQSQTIMNKR